MRKIARAVAALAVASALLLSATGCGDIGHRILYGTLKPKSNHENQRESALHFRTVWANVERIRFTEEGSKAGLSSWSANAVATVTGRDYNVIIGPDIVVIQHTDPPAQVPTLPPATSPRALTVVYSDGTIEVIQ